MFGEIKSILQSQLEQKLSNNLVISLTGGIFSYNWREVILFFDLPEFTGKNFLSYFDTHIEICCGIGVGFGLYFAYHVLGIISVLLDEFFKNIKLRVKNLEFIKQMKSNPEIVNSILEYLEKVDHIEQNTEGILYEHLREKTPEHYKIWTDHIIGKAKILKLEFRSNSVFLPYIKKVKNNLD